MNVADLKLREIAAARWGDERSPHFDSILHTIEEAIARLPAGEDSGVRPWPPAPLPPATTPRIAVEPARLDADLTEAGAASLAAAIRTGTVRSADVVEALLERSARLEPALHVWAHLDEASARHWASERDATKQSGATLGPLHGVPLGLKDIIQAEALPTQANSRVTPTFPSADEAAAVASLRQAGAVILGKTATTEYAYRDVSEARNPWNPAHTPGGSSSGSAAGVAARLMPAALGTQTAGSVLRPAAYCGVVGFKPSTERISRAGVVTLARSLDHVGTLTRTVADAALLYGVMAGADEHEIAVERPRLAFWPDLLTDHTDEITRTALRAAAGTLERAGARIAPVESEAAFNHTDGVWQELLAGHLVIMAAEVAAYHLDTHPERLRDLGPHLRAFVEVGALVPARALLKAQSQRLAWWQQWHERSEARRYDAVIVPAAPGTAPPGLERTGDASLNAPWSLLGVPAITLPIAVAENGLPLGMQLVAPYGEDARLLAVAHWCEQAIGFTARPAL